MRRSGVPALLLAIACLIGQSAVAASPVAAAPSAAAGVSAAISPAAASGATSRPCPDSIFTCVTLPVPRDHAQPGGATFKVTFAIHRAAHSPRKGVFVTVTGGPGTSGIAAADSYTAAFDPAIVDDYDLVFFDQRGVGRSQALQCPEAALAFYDFPGDPSQDLAHGLRYAGASKTFAHDCVAETGSTIGRLRLFSTAQAVEDLEAFRAWLGAPKIDLYGESYGTQFVQAYAAAHPDRLHSLFVDGPVDLTLTGLQFLREQAHAFDTVLSMTLDTCSADSACRADVSRAVTRSRATTSSPGSSARHPAATPSSMRQRQDRPAHVHPVGPRDRGRRLRLQHLRPDAVPAGARPGVARPPAAPRPAGLPVARTGPGHARRHPGPDLVRRDVLRGRVHGLRLPNGQPCRQRAHLPPGGSPRRHARRPPRQRVLRRPAVRVLAGPSADRPPAATAARDAVPGVRAGVVDRSRDALRGCAAGSSIASGTPTSSSSPAVRT